ncbi:MAG TPA: TetR/AcrR family transcriptional regulator [Bacilli bacterium]|nr:TetR/AcrR family transcriptional regulator [Bacilli bacterium]
MIKKDRTIRKILDAATIEFGQKGYELASTNRIAELSGVSKGSIFSYFKTKAELFFSVYKDKMNHLLTELDENKQQDTIDVFEKMLAITVWKMEYFNKRPLDSKILLEAVTNPPAELRTLMSNEMEHLMKFSVNQFFNEIDMSRFKEEYTKEEVLQFIQFALAGIQNGLIKPGMSLDDMNQIKELAMKYLKTVIKGMEK